LANAATDFTSFGKALLADWPAVVRRFSLMRPRVG
jgi:hypothetical protein